MSKHLKYKSFGYVILTDFYSNFIYNMKYTVKKGFLLIYRHFQFPYFILSKKTIIFYTWKNGFHFDRIIFLILIIRYCNQIEIKMIFSPNYFAVKWVIQLKIMLWTYLHILFLSVFYITMILGDIQQKKTICFKNNCQNNLINIKGYAIFYFANILNFYANF